MEFRDSKITIDSTRWNVYITIQDPEGHEHKFVASADSWYADSGIWFGTQEEFEEDSW